MHRGTQAHIHFSLFVCTGHPLNSTLLFCHTLLTAQSSNRTVNVFSTQCVHSKLRTKLSILIVVFCAVMSCSLVDTYQRFAEFVVSLNLAALHSARSFHVHPRHDLNSQIFSSICTPHVTLRKRSCQCTIRT
jgi:hypothetical protein